MMALRNVRVLSLVLFLIFGGLLYNCAKGDIQEGLVAYFKFDEGKGSELKDSSGGGNDATIIGKVEWVEGKYDKGLKFDGENSYADISPGTVGPFDSVTITAWVKIAKMPSSHSYNIAGMTTGPGSGFYVELYSVNLAAWQCQPNNTNANTPYPAKFDDWHHVAGVYTGSEIRLYIDGEMKSKGAGAKLPDTSSLPFRISGNHSEAQNWAGSINGVIDEVRLYERVLEDKEIREAMEPGQGMKVAPAGNLSATWGRIKIIL